MQNRYILTFLCALTALMASAAGQIAVLREEFNPQETTAMVYTGEKKLKDRNNRDYALVVVHNTLPEYLFDDPTHQLRAENRTTAAGEKVTYILMPESSKHITVRHRDASVKPLQYSFDNAPLEALRTYHLYLADLQMGGSGMQYLTFTLYPPNATLSVKEKDEFVPWVVTDGIAEKLMPYGKYQYMVAAAEHHRTSGIAEVNNPNAPTQEVVRLRPNFGQLSIPASAMLQDAIIFVDDMQHGKGGMDAIRLSAGQHTVKIVKPLHAMYTKTFTISEGENMVLHPELQYRACRATLQCSVDDAELYLLEGKRERNLGFSGAIVDLEPGTYVVEARAPGHKDSQYTLVIPENKSSLSVNVTPPTAQYGSLNISSTPRGATITLDGKPYGNTPVMLNNLLARQYALRLTAPGYVDHTATVEVAPNDTRSITATMSKSYAQREPKTEWKRVEQPAAPKGADSDGQWYMQGSTFAMFPSGSTQVLNAACGVGLGWQGQRWSFEGNVYGPVTSMEMSMRNYDKTGYEEIYIDYVMTDFRVGFGGRYIRAIGGVRYVMPLDGPEGVSPGLQALAGLRLSTCGKRWDIFITPMVQSYITASPLVHWSSSLFVPGVDLGIKYKF